MVQKGNANFNLEKIEGNLVIIMSMNLDCNKKKRSLICSTKSLIFLSRIAIMIFKFSHSVLYVGLCRIELLKSIGQSYQEDLGGIGVLRAI